MEVDELSWMLASARITTQDSALLRRVILVPKGQMLQWEKNKRKGKKMMAINECNRIMMWAWSFSSPGWAVRQLPLRRGMAPHPKQGAQCKEQTIARPDKAKNPVVARSAWNRNVETSG